jgi:uncharacterized protein (UPF0333 family)
MRIMGGRLRGQSSVEYLLIVGIALGVLIPAVFFFASYSGSQEATGVGAQIDEIGLAVTTAASEAYALGAGSRRQVEVSLPEGITRIWVNGTELAIAYESAYGPSEAVFFSAVALNSTYPDGNVTAPHAGLARFRVVSLGPSVLITEVVS